MSEMVERAAKAITFSLSDVICHGNDIEADLVAYPRWAEAMARAAIASMREPSDVMTEGLHAGGEKISSIEARGIWQDMIDKALAE